MIAIVVLMVIIAAVLLVRSVYLVPQAEAVIVERLGRYDRTLTAGIHFLVPFVDSPHYVTWTYLLSAPDRKYHRYLKTFCRIDLRECVYDFPKQNVITKDNVMMEVNALLYYLITDPKRAIYELVNVPEAIEKLTQTTLRNVIGSLDLDESLVSRDAINEKLRIILDEATDKWGVKITRVELQEVNPPHDIRIAMEKQMRAERDRRAVILESEGLKQAAILKAEGQRESAILHARGVAESRVIESRGEAEARLEVIEAEAKAIDLVKKAAPGQDPLTYLAAIQYIKTIPSLMEGKDNKLIVVPYEAAGLSGSIAAMKKILSDIQ
jgi:regulator of protease activity HflC (stomatin/prohibitin superfamily)